MITLKFPDLDNERAYSANDLSIFADQLYQIARYIHLRAMTRGVDHGVAVHPKNHDDSELEQLYQKLPEWCRWRPIVPSWKNTFNAMLQPDKPWSNLSDACDTARTCGYRYIAWRGTIYEINSLQEIQSSVELK